MKLDELRQQLRRTVSKPKSMVKEAASMLSASTGSACRSLAEHCDCCSQKPSSFLGENFFCDECIELMKRRASAAANLCDLCLSSDVKHCPVGERPFPRLCSKCLDLDWEEDHRS